MRNLNEEFLAATFSGDAERVDHLLASKMIDLNYQDAKGMTALHYACAGNHLALVEKLVVQYDEAAKEIVNRVDQFGDSALHMAVNQNNLAMVELLLRANASPVCSNKRGETPILLAAENGRVSLLWNFLEVNKDCDTLPLMLVAIKCGHIDVIKLLLSLPIKFRSFNWMQFLVAAIESGQSVIFEYLQNIISSEENFINYTTQLFIKAAKKGDIKVVQELIAIGVYTDKDFMRGAYLVSLALMEGHIAVFKLLIAAAVERKFDFYYVDLLRDAVSIGEFETINLLVEAGTDLQQFCNEHGKDALFAAARAGDVSVVKWLLNLGLSPHSVNEKSRDLLFVAAEAGHVSVVKLLLDSGVSPDANALISAAENGRAGVVESLFQFGMHVNNSRSQGGYKIALNVAAAKGHVEVVRVLIEFGVDSNALTAKEGFTALHFAVEHGCAEVVQELLAAGAAPNVRTHRGHTPFDLAVIRASHDPSFNRRIIELLLAAGAGLSYKSEESESAAPRLH